MGQCPGCTQNLSWAQEGWPRGLGAVQGEGEGALKDEAHQRGPLLGKAPCGFPVLGGCTQVSLLTYFLSQPGVPKAADLGQAPRCSYSLTCRCRWQPAELLPGWEAGTCPLPQAPKATCNKLASRGTRLQLSDGEIASASPGQMPFPPTPACRGQAQPGKEAPPVRTLWLHLLPVG